MTPNQHHRRVYYNWSAWIGAVPATLLMPGEPEEVEAYRERLIKEVGASGGFILSSGCTIQVDAKAENVKAMLLSVELYRPRDRRSGGRIKHGHRAGLSG